MTKEDVLTEAQIVEGYCDYCSLFYGAVTPRQRTDCSDCYRSLKKGVEMVDITVMYKKRSGY